AHHGAVLVVAALELHVVEQDERVDLRHAMQVPEPRQVMRLVNGDDHWIGGEGTEAGATMTPASSAPLGAVAGRRSAPLPRSRCRVAAARRPPSGCAAPVPRSAPA